MTKRILGGIALCILALVLLGAGGAWVAIRYVERNPDSERIPWRLVARLTYDCSEIDAALEAYDDWPIETMRAIARAESKCDVSTIGDTNLTFERYGRTYGYSVGAMQVRILPGREHCDTLDVETNVSCANWIYNYQGLRAWSVWNNGRYLRYMSQEYIDNLESEPSKNSD
ncbi:hypothetical protein FWC63_03310 [Candidatus Saccharibacteria bacterium]|nr:hypothetical protein [Candidatus Saccharibacteria bacterium]